jgi:hypothetical protein
MRRFVVSSLVLLLFMANGLAWADDFDPPSWRGLPGTSYAQWEFLTDVNPAMPDAGVLPFGNPDLLVTPGPGAGWFAQNPPYNPDGPSGDGWWNLSGQIDLTMQDSPVLNPHKEIWIQLTWSPQVPGNVPILQVNDPISGTTPEFSTPLVQHLIYEQYPGLEQGLQVYQSVYHVDRIPNPPWEHIQIRGGINVDELVVDTWCVPEPGTWLLLGGASLVGLVFGWHRRK